MIDDELETEELESSDDSAIDADDLDIDDVDDIDDDVDDDSVEEDSVDDGSDAVVTPSRVKSKAAVSADELPSVEAKQKERDALAKAMEDFFSARWKSTGS